MNKFLRVLLKLLIIGILIHLFCYHIALFLIDLLCLYFNTDLVFFIDFNTFYKYSVSVCWFFYFLCSIFQLIAIFVVNHKHGIKVLYLICFISFLILLL